MLSSNQLSQLFILLLPCSPFRNCGSKLFVPFEHQLLLLKLELFSHLCLVRLDLILHFEDLHILRFAFLAQLVDLRNQVADLGSVLLTFAFESAGYACLSLAAFSICLC